MSRISWFLGLRPAKKSCHHSNPLKVENAPLIFLFVPATIKDRIAKVTSGRGYKLRKELIGE
jgi:hypothetical protein